MSSAAREFWTETERYHDLAIEYEKNIEVHGARGFYECDLNGLVWHCPYCATNVKYYEYRGPKF
jgi:hypothetical protein